MAAFRLLTVVSIILYVKLSHCSIFNTVNSTQYQGGSIICDEGESCSITCDEERSCYQTTIQCPTNATCDIQCMADYACQKAVITWPTTPGLGTLLCDSYRSACEALNLFPIPDPDIPLNISCNTFRQCFGTTIHCPTNAKCHLDCTGAANVCTGATVYWPGYAGLGSLECSGQNACKDLYTFPPPDPNIDLIIGCDGRGLCAGATLLCPNNAECHVFCENPQACLDTVVIWATDPDINDTLHCTNHSRTCEGINHPPTSSPTTSSPTTSLPTTSLPTTINPTLLPTLYPTTIPTVYPSLNPITAIPTNLPTSTVPSLFPTPNTSYNSAAIQTMDTTISNSVTEEVGNDKLNTEDDSITVILAIIGACVGIVIIVFCVFLCIKWRKEKAEQDENTGRINSISANSIIATPMSTMQMITTKTKMTVNQTVDGDEDGDEDEDEDEKEQTINETMEKTVETEEDEPNDIMIWFKEIGLEKYCIEYTKIFMDNGYEEMKFVQKLIKIKDDLHNIGITKAGHCNLIIHELNILDMQTEGGGNMNQENITLTEGNTTMNTDNGDNNELMQFHVKQTAGNDNDENNPGIMNGDFIVDDVDHM